MNKSNINELSVETEADSNSTAQNKQVSQPNANTNVGGSCFSKGSWYVGKIFPLPVIYCDGKKVANIARELPIEEREANARLMSAAPELLESLIQIIALTDRRHTEWYKAKAAIKKALGA